MIKAGVNCQTRVPLGLSVRQLPRAESPPWYSLGWSEFHDRRSRLIPRKKHLPALPRNFKMGIEYEPLMNAILGIYRRYSAASGTQQFPFRNGTRARGLAAVRATSADRIPTFSVTSKSAQKSRRHRLRDVQTRPRYPPGHGLRRLVAAFSFRRLVAETSPFSVPLANEDDPTRTTTCCCLSPLPRPLHGYAATASASAPKNRNLDSPKGYPVQPFLEAAKTRLLHLQTERTHLRTISINDGEHIAENDAPGREG